MTPRSLLLKERSDSCGGGVGVNGLNIRSVGGAVWTLAEPLKLGHILFSIVQSHLDQVVQRRFRMDYSPYPGPSLETQYDQQEIEEVITRSLQQAEDLVGALEQQLQARR